MELKFRYLVMTDINLFCFDDISLINLDMSSGRQNTKKCLTVLLPN